MRKLVLCCVLGCLPAFAPAAAAMTVTSTGETGACTLRGALEAVNTNNSGTACGSVLSGGFTPVNLPANTYTPFDGQLQVASGAKVEIIGASINDPLTTVIDATTNVNPHRVFEVLSGGQLKLTGLQVTGGRTLNGSDAASYPDYGGTADNGAGILNKGSLTLDHVFVTQNITGHGGLGSDGGYDAQHDAKGGGGGGRGGGIYNSAGASLVVTASTISGNGTGGGGDGGTGSIGIGGLGHYASGGQGGNGGPPGPGGGIFNAGSASITTSTISGNFTGRGGNGGNGGQGAGPFNDGMGHTFGAGKGGSGGDGGSASYSRDGYCQCYQLNSALGGGGIANVEGGSLTMTASTVSGNNTGAGGNGGGAGIGGMESGHTVTGSAGGFAGSGGVGAGLFSSYGIAILTNVTFSGNFTGDGGIGGNGPTSGSLGPGPGGYGGNGGAIWAAGAHSPYYVQLTHVTISKNSLGDAGPAGAPGAPPEGSGPFPGLPGVRGKGSGIAVGGRYDTSGTGVYLKNTIIANNGLVSDANCVDSGAAPTNYLDQGGNLTWGGTTCPGTSADPMLGILNDNGGPTETMLPASGSAAIGAIPSGSCVGTEDQRGYPRPGTGKSSCDSGAVETGPPPGVTATATALSSSANPSTPGQQVTFTATVSPIPGSGKVSFTDGGTFIPGCEEASFTGSGQTTCQTSFPSAGTHAIVANYLGNSEFTPSSSATLSQLVQSSGGGPGPGPGPGPGGNEGGGGNGGGGGGGAKPVHCPKSKKRVVVKGKVRCVPKHKHRHKPKHH